MSIHNPAEPMSFSSENYSERLEVLSPEARNALNFLRQFPNGLAVGIFQGVVDNATRSELSTQKFFLHVTADEAAEAWIKCSTVQAQYAVLMSEIQNRALTNKEILFLTRYQEASALIDNDGPSNQVRVFIPIRVQEFLNERDLTENS